MWNEWVHVDAIFGFLMFFKTQVERENFVLILEYFCSPNCTVSSEIFIKWNKHGHMIRSHKVFPDQLHFSTPITFYWLADYIFQHGTHFKEKLKLASGWGVGLWFIVKTMIHCTVCLWFSYCSLWEFNLPYLLQW